MLQTVELDTWGIADRLGELNMKLHLAQLACDGIACNDGEGGLVANMLQEARETLAAITDDIHPGPSVEEEIAHIRRVAEKRIAKLKEEVEPDGENPESRRAKIKAVQS